MSVIELGSHAFYLTEKSALITPRAQDILGARPTMGIIDPMTVDQSQDVVYWGSDNNFPAMIRDQAYKNPIIPRAILFHANMVAGAEILPVQKDYDENNKPIHRIVRDPEIWEYLDSAGHRRYMRESASDLYWYQNIFPEFIITKNRQKIAQLSPNEAMFCRWATQNSKGICTEVIHNANWPNARRNHQYSEIIPAIDPYAYDMVEALREDSKKFKVIYPASYPSPGALFYQTAFWDGIRQSKYLEFLSRIPEIKNQILKNKIKPTFHVQLPMTHWERWFGAAWQEADHVKKQRLKEDYLQTLEDILTSQEGAGSAFVTEYGSSTTDNSLAEKWEITAIEDKTLEGTYIQDNIDATVQLLAAMALDPALIGYSSKESGTRNGGSDKFQSLQNYLVTMSPFNDIILEPMRFMARFNGWTKKYPRFDFIATYPMVDKLNAKGDVSYKDPKKQDPNASNQ